MRIMITGVHGFVGTNLVKELSRKHSIFGLDIVNPIKEGIKFTYKWENLDTEKMPEVDAIIHLAGKAHDTKNEAAAEVYFKVNRDLTIKIFDYFLAHENIKKFVFFSTAKAAADRVEGVLTEDVVPSPVGPYGESKIEAEKYLLSKMEDVRSKSKDVYIFKVRHWSLLCCHDVACAILLPHHRVAELVRGGDEAVGGKEGDHQQSRHNGCGDGAIDETSPEVVVFERHVEQGENQADGGEADERRKGGDGEGEHGFRKIPGTQDGNDDEGEEGDDGKDRYEAHYPLGVTFPHLLV